MLRAAKLFGAIAGICAVLVLVGALLSNAWYADDACPVEEWKCSLGSAGFAIGLYAAVGAAASGLIALGTGALHLWRRRRHHGIGARADG